MLQELELEAQRLAGQPEIRGIDLDDRRFADVRTDQSLGGFDVGAAYDMQPWPPARMAVSGAQGPKPLLSLPFPLCDARIRLAGG